MFALARCGRICRAAAGVYGTSIGAGGATKCSEITSPTVSGVWLASLLIGQRGRSSDSSTKDPLVRSTTGETTTAKLSKMAESKEDLRKRLTPLQYQVTQEAGTERPFTGKYDKFYESGMYQCIVCHQDLFSSQTKYDSGCGWPAFNDVLDKGKITLHRDASIAERIRTEVRCAQCGAHMGHVFEDGPAPTRKRYCINSASIEFLSADELNAKQ